MGPTSKGRGREGEAEAKGGDGKGKGRGGDETPPLHAPQSIFLDTPLV